MHVPLGVVHRDISPQNVLVGIDGVARVLDFGIAKAVGRLQTTQKGQIKGKMAYLAPEQLRGKVIDRRADIYGAAVVLWEALTGATLFDGENDSIVAAQVLGAKIDAPGARAPGISPALDALTLRGLERDPQNRFATAREMALAMQLEVGLVAASEVGDWVARVAKEPLAARLRYMGELDRLSARDQRQRQTPGGSRSSPALRVDQYEDGRSTRLHSAPATIDDDAARQRRPSQRRRVTVLLGGALSIGLVSLLGLIAARSLSPSTPRVMAIDRAFESTIDAPGTTSVPVLASSAVTGSAPAAPSRALETKTGLEPPSHLVVPNVVAVGQSIARTIHPAHSLQGPPPIVGGRGPSIPRPAEGVPAGPFEPLRWDAGR
jgi:serine/threonine-protein kinase